MTTKSVANHTRKRRMSVSKWICEVCKKPINPGEGRIQIDAVSKEGKVGGYPSWDLEPYRDQSNSKFPEFVSAVELAERSIRLRPKGPGTALHRKRLIACHITCDRWPDSDSYWLAIERVSTLEKWCETVCHVAGKAWMTSHDVGVMLEYWWTNRGARVWDGEV